LDHTKLESQPGSANYTEINKPDMYQRSEILGVILAGGAGRRMFADQGRDSGRERGEKGLIDLNGRPMLAYVIERLAPQVSEIILNANGDPSRFADFGLPIIADHDDSRAGPLAGFAAAMAWAEQNRPDIRAILTVSVDAPFLPSDLAARLSHGSQNGPAIATSNGQRHPTIGLWPISLESAVLDALANRQRRAENFAQHHQAVAVSFPFSEIGKHRVDPFFNTNTPEDVAAARAILTG
jgi:molybdopterin-guanine dinucleotide biosynthesis protein A